MTRNLAHDRARWFTIFLAATLVATAPVQTHADPPPHVLSWGGTGSGDGQFLRPFCIAAGPGVVVVGDAFRTVKIQTFTPGGLFVSKWGTAGFLPGQFNDGVYGVAVGPSGEVFALDYGEVERYSSAGSSLGSIGSFGTGPGQMRFPKGVAVDGDGFVYVADTDNARVQKFTAAGVPVAQWGTRGTGNGQFQRPWGIALDPAGFVYVSDFDPTNACIQKFTTSGVFLLRFGSFGSGEDGLLANPAGLAVDSSGRVYVADAGNDQVQVFGADGGFVTRWGSEGSGTGQFSSPNGIAIDAEGFVYVADTLNNRIQKFGPASTPVTEGTWGRLKAQYRN